MKETTSVINFYVKKQTKTSWLTKTFIFLTVLWVDW